MCVNPIKIKVYNDPSYPEGKEIEIKCGKCNTCLKEKASDWAIKLINENKYHTKACFITLTFDNTILTDSTAKAWKYIKKNKLTGEYLEPIPSSFLWNIDYSKEYVRKFIKRLRKKFAPTRITYFKVGEYGEKFKRPHYHMILFGIDFEEDRVKAEISKSGHEQYYSETLENLWALGRTRIELINDHNIAYCSQYSVKKLKTDNMDETKFFNNYILKETKRTKKYEDENAIIYSNSKIKYEYKYKPKISFSNRGKFNKWIRKHPENILKGYLKDKDGKKYKVPQAYLRILKNSNNKRHNDIYSEYIEKVEDYINNTDPKLLKMIRKNKEEILKSKNKKIERLDF